MKRSPLRTSNEDDVLVFDGSRSNNELGPGTWIRVKLAAVSGRLLGLDRRRTAYRG